MAENKPYPGPKVDEQHDKMFGYRWKGNYDENYEDDYPSVKELLGSQYPDIKEIWLMESRRENIPGKGDTITFVLLVDGGNLNAYQKKILARQLEEVLHFAEEGTMLQIFSKGENSRYDKEIPFSDVIYSK